MRKFLSLPQEKQDRIVNAAMTLFGSVGYKKAYISEIASGAGISKALVFHYFGSKKGLYSYLVYYTGKVIMTEAQSSKDLDGKGFFDRALITLKFRLMLKSKYPAMDAFINSVYNEDDPEVASDTERLLAIATDMHAGISFMPGDDALWREGIDERILINILSKYTEGVVGSLTDNTQLDAVIEEATECIGTMESFVG